MPETCGILTTRTVGFLVALSAMAYMGTISYSFKQIPKALHSKDKQRKEGITYVSTFSVSLLFLLFQLSSSLSLLLTRSDNLRKSSVRWLIFNISMYVLLVICYLVPFSFNHSESRHATGGEFVGSVNDHFNKIVYGEKELSDPSLLVFWTGIAHFIAGAVGVILVSCSICCLKDGYSGIN